MLHYPGSGRFKYGFTRPAPVFFCGFGVVYGELVAFRTALAQTFPQFHGFLKALQVANVSPGEVLFFSLIDLFFLGTLDMIHFSGTLYAHLLELFIYNTSSKGLLSIKRISPSSSSPDLSLNFTVSPSVYFIHSPHHSFPGISGQKKRDDEEISPHEICFRYISLWIIPPFLISGSKT
jgi:hypothetical protein